jgi:hypothetical protein
MLVNPRFVLDFEVASDVFGAYAGHYVTCISHPVSVKFTYVIYFPNAHSVVRAVLGAATR